MKNVVQVVQHLRPGGIESLTLDLASFTANEKVFVVSLEGDIESALANWPKLIPFREQLFFLNKQPGIQPNIVLQLLKLFKKIQADAVHTHHIGPLLYAGLAARISALSSVIHTEHDAWHLTNKKRCLIQRLAIKLFKPTLVADAQVVAQQMQNRLKIKESIKVIYNGIDSARFKPGDNTTARNKLGLPTKACVIGCSGRMESVKGQNILIDALRFLPQHIHLALAGSGSMEAELRKLVDTLYLQDRVHFLGHLDEMPTFYQALDLFCLPSLNEGFPLSPLEAQACNVKALVTDVGASKETLCPESGDSVSANNSQAMAKKIIDMLSRYNSSQPRQFVKSKGDVHIMAQSYADLRLATGG